MNGVTKSSKFSMTRRRFLGTAAVTLAAPPLLSACSSEQEELNVMAWATYLTPEIIDIMAKAGVKVRAIPAETDQEMFTKLQAGGASAYDIVFANSGWSPTYYKAGLIEAFDAGEVKGSDQIYPVFLEDATFPYIVSPGSSWRSPIPGIAAAWSGTWNMCRSPNPIPGWPCGTRRSPRAR